MNRTTYRRTFLHLSNRVERMLRVALYTLFGLLVVSQLLLRHEPIRYWLLETVRLEGIPAYPEQPCFGTNCDD